jgi:hypothetical protein
MSAIEEAAVRVESGTVRREPARAGRPERRVPAPARVAIAFALVQLPLMLIAAALDWRTEWGAPEQAGAALADSIKYGSAISGPLAPQVVLLVLAAVATRRDRFGLVATAGIGLMGVLIAFNGTMSALSDPVDAPAAALVTAGAVFAAAGLSMLVLSLRELRARRRTLIAATLLVCCLAAPAMAKADSIAYVKNHNIWIANPDGSGQYQVTRDGTAGRAYGSPSQADDGTISAYRGTDVVRLRQNGQILSSFDPPGATNSAGGYVDGVPANVAVSPDGSKVAYTFYDVSCPPGASCGARTVTTYSASDRATPYGRLFERNPSWATNNRLLVFGGYLSHVNYDDPDNGTHDRVHWFDDQDTDSPSTDLGDGELTRQGDRFAALRGYGSSTHLRIYKVNGNALTGSPGVPSVACQTGAETTLDNPSWSPDGRRLSFAHREGIEVIALPNVVDGDCPGAGSGVVVIPGGQEPDWGPANVNPGPRAGTGTNATPKKRASSYKRALAKCKKAKSRKRRARCIKRVKRARALKLCKRKKSKAARKRCVRKAKRRYRI